MKKDVEKKADSQIAVWVAVALLALVKVFFMPTLSWWIVLFPITIVLALWCVVGGILALSMVLIVIAAILSTVFGKKI